MSDASAPAPRASRPLEARRKVLVVSHNNPDPDSIVSALLLDTLLSRVFGIDVTVGAPCYRPRREQGSPQCLRAPARWLADLELGGFETIALVDTQPGTGNHPFDDARRVSIVLDHHRLRPDTRHVAFYDVRDYLASTTTLLYVYWRVWKLDLAPKFATAMLYALRSETRRTWAGPRPWWTAGSKDLYALASSGLSRIVNAKVGEAYFSAIHKAIERAVVYGPLVVVGMGGLRTRTPSPQESQYFLKFEEG